MINTGTVNHPLRPMSLPVSTIPMQGLSPANQNVHIKQTMDRLRCIQKHLKNPALFGRTIRELIDWCSDPRAFRPHFQQCLLECLQAVSDVAGNQGYDLGLCYRLLQMCHEQREKFIPPASAVLGVMFRRVQGLMISKQPSSHVDTIQMPGQQISSGPYGNSMMNAKQNMGQYHHMGQRVPEQSLWNQQPPLQNVPHLNQHPSLSVITTATVWDVSTTQTPPALGYSQSSSTSFNSQHLTTHPGPQPGGANNMLSGYPNDYPNKQMMNDSYVQPAMGVPPGRVAPQRHLINQDQSHHPSAAAAAAAAVAAAAAAATATATATATFIKEHQDQNQMNSYEQVPPPMNGPMHQPALTPHPPGGAHPGMQHSGRVRQQMPPEYGRAASVPTSFPLSSPRPLSHTPTPSYGNDNFKQSCRPQLNPYGSPPFNNEPNPLKTPDIFPHSHDSGPGFCSRPPGSNIVQSNSYYPPPQQESYPGLQNHRHHIPPQPHGPNQHQAPPLNDTRFCNSQPSIPGNPTPPLTPGSAHNIPPYPNPGVGGLNEQNINNDPLFPNYVAGGPVPTESDDLRLTFPVRDGVVLRPFRLEHNLSVSSHAFHLRDHVHKTLFERPDLDLQFKCFHHEDNMKHTNWPHLVQIQVNATPLPVPRGMDRASHKPFYLKNVCRPGRNVIEIAVSACCCSHYFVLQLVHRPSIPFVLKGLLVKRLLPDLNCRTKIKRNFTNGDVSTNDVMISAPSGSGGLTQAGGVVRVSLFCPITRNRMRIPARGQDCKHIQCFDLESYLRSNSENASWACPVCNKLALLELLEVDEFMQGILKSAARDCHHVSIDSNCTWNPLSGPPPSPFAPNQLPRTMSGPAERNFSFPGRFAKQELHNCGVKREPGARQPGFASNQENYISALSIKKEPRQNEFHVKPDPDGPPHKRLKSATSPGVSLSNLPAPSPVSAGACNKMEHGSGFPQSKNISKFGGPRQMQKSPGSGGTMRSGELMVADMKEYVAANDMVSIEKRLNPAVNPAHAGPVPANIGPIPENSPKRKSTCQESTKSSLGPSTPLRPPSNSVALNPQSIGAVNCAPPSAPNHSGYTTSSNDFPSDIGDVNVVSANPETPVVSDLNLDALDSVFEPFFDSTAHGKEAPDSSSLGLDSLSSIAKSDVETNVSQVDSGGDILDIFSDLGATASNPTNAEEENILSLFDDTS